MVCYCRHTVLTSDKSLAQYFYIPKEIWKHRGKRYILNKFSTRQLCRSFAMHPAFGGHSYNKTVETTHIKFCKRYCLLYNNCPDAFALSECGRLPLCTTYMYNCIYISTGYISFALSPIDIQNSAMTCYFNLIMLAGTLGPHQ